jgi:hypothetical protein
MDVAFVQRDGIQTVKTLVSGQKLIRLPHRRKAALDSSARLVDLAQHFTDQIHVEHRRPPPATKHTTAPPL